MHELAKFITFFKQHYNGMYIWKVRNEENDDDRVYNDGNWTYCIYLHT